MIPAFNLFKKLTVNNKLSDKLVQVSNMKYGIHI